MVSRTGVAERPPVRDDAWNTEHRADALLQRADRNFAEQLQELRVARTGAHRPARGIPDSPLGLSEGVAADEFRTAAAEGHLVGHGTLVGVVAR